jgi:heme/copper-type cytochrome/quinol oxidase subunit 3
VTAGAAAVAVASRRIGSGDAGGLQRWLAASLGITAAGVALQLRELFAVPFGWTEHAYGSIYFLTAGFCVLAVAAAWVMAALTLVWSRRGQYSARRRTVPLNTARFSAAMAVIWLTGFGVLYLAPLLT